MGFVLLLRALAGGASITEYRDRSERRMTNNEAWKPSTEDVREFYQFGRHENGHRGGQDAREHEFDRWLAEHDREVRLATLIEARDAATRPYPGLGWEDAVAKIDALIEGREPDDAGSES